MNGGDIGHLERVLPPIGVVVNKIGTVQHTGYLQQNKTRAHFHLAVLLFEEPREWPFAFQPAWDLFYVSLNSVVILLTIGRR